MDYRYQHSLHVIDYYLWLALHGRDGKLLFPSSTQLSCPEATFRDLDVEEEARDGWVRNQLRY